MSIIHTKAHHAQFQADINSSHPFSSMALDTLLSVLC